MSWKDDPWVLVDLETTGKDPETAAVCQIGWRVFRNGEPCEGEEHLVNPGETIPAEATAIHGIADGDVANAPTLEEVWPLLQAALADAAVVAGYNAWGYDFPILRRLLPDFIPTITGKAILDPIVVIRLPKVGQFWRNNARRYPDIGRHTLLNAAEASGIATSRESAHGALYDCDLAGQILWRWRDRLPDDGAEAQRWLRAQKKRQDDRYNEWKASQPKDPQ